MPTIDPSAFIAHSAVVVGDATIAANCGIWYNAVIRADEDSVTIGANSNVQDNAVIHNDVGFPVVIGEGVTVGHAAIVHGCHIGDNTVIGMGAIVLNGAVVGRNCIIGAGALVTQGTEIPDGSVAFGNPAKVRRPMQPDDIEANRHNAGVYVELARQQLEQ